MDGATRAPGWYTDERFPDDERWWDGERWGESRPGGYGGPGRPAPGLGAGRRERSRYALASIGAMLAMMVALAVLVRGVSGKETAQGTDASGGPAAHAAAGYAFLSTSNGSPVRHDPCVPVHVLWNLGRAPGERALLTAALAEVRRATGLTFVDEGDIDLMPGGVGDTGSGLIEHDDYLTIAVSSRTGADASLYLAESDRESIGVGGYEPGAPGRIRDSYVVIDAASLPDLSRDDRYELYLHELGHALGLDHVDDPGQVMYPELQDPPLRGYGPGDLAGLRALGEHGDCAAR